MFSSLTRDNKLQYIKMPKEKTGKAVAITDFQFVVPTRFLTRGLLAFSAVVNCLAVGAVIVGNKFKAVTLTSMIEFVPSSIEQSKDKKYYIFNFRKGMDFASPTVPVSTDVVKPFIDETMVKGNIPEYLDYWDLLSVFENIQATTGSALASDKVIISALVSLLARCEDDTDKPWRLAGPKDKLKWIGFNDVAHSRRDGYAQLIGAYFREGLTGSSLRDEDFMIELEKIMKGI